MNTELFNAVSEARPETMEKIAKAIYVLERIEPAFAAELTEEISAITDYTKEKMSTPIAWGDTGKAVAMMAAVPLLGAVATDLYDAAKRGLTKGMNYKRIMDWNPDLAKNYDKGSVQRAYSTFHRYAPDFTADPNLGGQILKAMVEIPDNQHQLVKDLLNSRKNLRDIKKGQYQFDSKAPVMFDESAKLENMENTKEKLKAISESRNEATDMKQTIRLLGNKIPPGRNPYDIAEGIQARKPKKP